MKDSWNPEQYNKFKDQRSRPFFDLMDMIAPGQIGTVLDLGCGTCELTQQLHKRFEVKSTLAMDASPNMLEEARRFLVHGITVELGDITNFSPQHPFDLVVSNAALQWVPDHEKLFPKILNWVKPGGQVAIQMPYNFDHPSHRIAGEIAATIDGNKFSKEARWDHVLELIRYSELLHQHGFSEQQCRIQVYGFPMASGKDVVEWVKGTLLNFYKERLDKARYEEFEVRYTQEILTTLGAGPYFYPFKRMLLWGRKA